jgi:hypothetical protein
MGEIVVNALPEVTLMAYEPVCEGSEAIELYGGMPEGGTYYVEGEEATIFEPVMAGTYMLEYVYTDENGCSNSAMGEIVVNPAPVAECPEYDAFCEGDDYIMFPVVEGGVYTDMDGEPVEGFEPMMTGEYMFSLTVVNEFDCVATCDFTIVVNPNPVPECPVFEPVCEGADYIMFPEVVDGVYTDMNGEPVDGFDPMMAGEYMFTLTVTNEFGCEGYCEFWIVVNALPEITFLSGNLDVLYGDAATFEITAENAATYEWYFGGEVVGTDATFVIDAVMLEDAGDYYCVVTSEDGCSVESDVVTLTVLPWTQQIDFGGAINGMSTYLDLELVEDDLPVLFADILANVSAVSFRNPDQSWAPSNGSFAFDEERGALVNLKNNVWPTSIDVMGYPTLGTDVELKTGVNYIPVWSQNVVLVDDVLGGLGADLKWAWSMDFTGLYAPSFNIFTLEYFVPGNSYIVEMNNGATVSFDVPAVDAAPGYADIPRNITTWDDATLTATQHNIFILADALTQLQVGDVIGAFNEYGQIAGMAEVTSTRDNMALRTFGDDPLTNRDEGFIDGDMMTIKIWRNGEEMVAQATFDTDMPNANIFAKDGVSAITNLKVGATSINDITAGLEASLYPNPATEFVNIETNFEISNIKVVNYVGQVVLDQNVSETNFQINTSDYRSGMYFVQIENNEGVVITKRLTIK